MKSLFVLVALATLAFAGANEFGVQVGYWNPTGDDNDGMAGNFYFGGQFIAHMEIIAVEASLGYLGLKLDDDAEAALTLLGGDYSGRIIPITVGVRSYNSSIYGAAGLEMDISKVEIDYAANPSNNVDESDNELGGYIGAGYIAVMGTTGDLDLNIRLHLMEFDTDKMWIGFGAGLNF